MKNREKISNIIIKCRAKQVIEYRISQENWRIITVYLKLKEKKKKRNIKDVQYLKIRK